MPSRWTRRGAARPYISRPSGITDQEQWTTCAANQRPTLHGDLPSKATLSRPNIRSGLHSTGSREKLRCRLRPGLYPLVGETDGPLGQWRCARQRRGLPSLAITLANKIPPPSSPSRCPLSRCRRSLDKEGTSNSVLTSFDINTLNLFSQFQGMVARGGRGRERKGARLSNGRLRSSRREGKR
jgi:hypothetical protein